jgi:hypothetical protein
MIASRTVYLLLTAVLVTALFSSAMASPGQSGGTFLKITPSARAAGMAAGIPGTAGTPFAIYGIPSGLASMHTAGFAATYINYFANVTYGYIAYATPLKGSGVTGFSYSYLLVDDIEKRGNSEEFLGTFNAKDTSLALSYAHPNPFPSILDGLALGATLKMINGEIDQHIAWSAALDLSADYRPVENITVALAVNNMGPGLKYSEERDPLPLKVSAGVAYDPSALCTVGLQVDEYLVDNTHYVALGTEYRPVHQLALRAGYTAGYDTASLGSTTGLASGIGFSLWSATIDYAFVPFGNLGDTHRLSLGLKF